MRLLSGSCCSCYSLILVTGVFCHYAYAAAGEGLPPKCCPENQVLVFDENRRTFTCSSEAFSERLLLHPPFYMDTFSDGFPKLYSKFPKCEEGETLIQIAAEQGNKISCLDKVLWNGGDEKNVGLLCVNESRKGFEMDGEDRLETFVVPDIFTINKCCPLETIIDPLGQGTMEGTYDVPDIFTINKCCPLERSYSGYVDGCWDHRVPDNKTYLSGLVVAVLNDSIGYIDLKTGAPTCKSNEVLYDYFVPYKFVFQLDSDAVKLRIPGREGYVILPPDSVCVDFVGEDQLNLVVRACQDRTVMCQIQGKTCISKCCADGETMLDHNTCSRSTHARFDPEVYAVETVENNEPIRVYEVNPAITFGIKCHKYLLRPDDEEYLDDRHYLTTRGDIYFPSDSSFIESYCIDVLTSMVMGNITVMATFICFDDNNSDYSSKLPAMRNILYFVYGFGMIISCFFLFLTLLVYMCLPSLRNVHGKTIMCYIASLLVAYLCLFTSQIGSLLNILRDNLTCKFAGYATVFAFLAAFSWLNVLCFDIWYTFGTVRSSFIKRQSSTSRFLLYNLYCWGYSSAVIMAAVGTDFAAYRGLISHVYVSDVGVSNCWISPHTKGLVIFFLVPIGFQLMSNIMLFILTIRHCYKVKSEIAKMQYNSTVKMRYNHDKRKLVMTVKLFIVMGIGWTLEILSQFIRPLDNLWFPSDVFNILQGILIFVIFTVKEKVIRGIKTKMSDILPACFEKVEKTRPPTLSSSVFTTSSSECKMSVNPK